MLVVGGSFLLLIRRRCCGVAGEAGMAILCWGVVGRGAGMAALSVCWGVVGRGAGMAALCWDVVWGRGVSSRVVGTLVSFRPLL